MNAPFYITEFWTGADGQRRLWFSEATAEDPTELLRDFAQEQLAVGRPSSVLIITWKAGGWPKPFAGPKNPNSP